MELHPWVEGDLGRGGVAQGDEREELEDQDHRGSESAEQREPEGRADQEVKEHHRPAQEDEHLKEIAQRAATQLLPPMRKERPLQEEPCRDADEVEAGWTVMPRAQRKHGVCEGE